MYVIVYSVYCSYTGGMVTYSVTVPVLCVNYVLLLCIQCCVLRSVVLCFVWTTPVLPARWHYLLFGSGAEPGVADVVLYDSLRWAGQFERLMPLVVYRTWRPLLCTVLDTTVCWNGVGDTFNPGAGGAWRHELARHLFSHITAHLCRLLW
jgi:hypothetical protein